MTANLYGLGLAVLGGALVGNCMVPFRHIRKWPWECTWIVFSVVSLLLVPCGLAFAVIPHWPSLYRGIPSYELMLPLSFGFGWGIAQVLFGIAVQGLGMALGFTLVVGLGTIFGTLIPYFSQSDASMSNAKVLLLLAGCVVMILGLTLSGWAGKMRNGSESSNQSIYGSGLLIATISGVLSCMLNLSLSFGEPLAAHARSDGASPSLSALGIWPVALIGGLLPNVAYAIYRMSRNHSWHLLAVAPADALKSALAGLLWISAVALYGIATHLMGAMGDSAGWAVYQISMVLTASLAGVISGEWRGAQHRSKSVFAAGIATLAASFVMVALSSRP
jgi:L-rhamnose-H+ transport protein